MSNALDDTSLPFTHMPTQTMSSDPIDIAEGVDTSGGSIRSRRKEARLEVGVFLFLIVPSMILSFFITRQGKVSFTFTAVSVILRDFALVCLILFFLWRNGEALSTLGWKSAKFGRNLLLGVALYPLLVYVIGRLESLLRAAGVPQPPTPGPSFFNIQGRWEVALAVILVTVVAISEETIFRGYLIRRFRTATGSVTAAVLLSSTVFALGHGYEGSLGVLTIGAMGMIFSLVYLWRGSLVTPIVLHFLQDFIAIIVVHYLQ